MNHLVLPVISNLKAELENLRLVGKALKVNLTVDKNNAESLNVVELLIDDEPGKHFFLTFVFAVNDPTTLMNLLSPTVIHFASPNVMIVTKSLNDWVKTIKEECRYNQLPWVVKIFNELQAFFERNDLAFYFIDKVKIPDEEGYYLR